MILTFLYDHISGHTFKNYISRYQIKVIFSFIFHCKTFEKLIFSMRLYDKKYKKLDGEIIRLIKELFWNRKLNSYLDQQNNAFSTARHSDWFFRLAEI